MTTDNEPYSSDEGKLYATPYYTPYKSVKLRYYKKFETIQSKSGSVAYCPGPAASLESVRRSIHNLLILLQFCTEHAMSLIENILCVVLWITVLHCLNVSRW